MALDIHTRLADLGIDPHNSVDPATGRLIIEAILSGTGFSDVTVHDFGTPGQHLVVDANGKISVKDSYPQGNIRPDQAGAGGVLTFTFPATEELIWIEAFSPTGVLTGPVARADPFGGVPNSGLGIPIFDSIPKPLVISQTVIKVYAVNGVSVMVWGQGYN